MTGFAHGLVVGKFYPPHAGHLRLVAAAAGACERVTVVVAANSRESLRLADRVEWLAWAAAAWPQVTVVGTMDDHPIDYDDPLIWDAHMRVFADAVAEVTRVPVDAVFSGEAYGDELARRLDARHVLVPRDIAATQARADLHGFWPLLAPPARPGLATLIVVLGPESTGTTTIAHALAERLGAAFVPEYGRTYTSRKLAELRQSAHEAGLSKPWVDELDWSSDEFTVIAARQSGAIAEAADRAPVVVADTDALATSVWHERYVGRPHLPSLALARSQPVDLYLLTTPDGVPFLQDGLRDGESIREGMTETFEAALNASGRHWLALNGPEAARLAGAEHACRALGPRRIAPSLP